ncbi:hypothetical protein HKX48_006009 [Thoreauomyces humboldtii]|nr:hypothetical protein HKX48_006009 [Thoreauomyces humboldtii]
MCASSEDAPLFHWESSRFAFPNQPPPTFSPAHDAFVGGLVGIPSSQPVLSNPSGSDLGWVPQRTSGGDAFLLANPVFNELRPHKPVAPGATRPGLPSEGILATTLGAESIAMYASEDDERYPGKLSVWHYDRAEGVVAMDDLYARATRIVKDPPIFVETLCTQYLLDEDGVDLDKATLSPGILGSEEDAEGSVETLGTPPPTFAELLPVKIEQGFIPPWAYREASDDSSLCSPDSMSSGEEDLPMAMTSPIASSHLPPGTDLALDAVGQIMRMGPGVTLCLDAALSELASHLRLHGVDVAALDANLEARERERQEKAEALYERSCTEGEESDYKAAGDREASDDSDYLEGRRSSRPKQKKQKSKVGKKLKIDSPSAGGSVGQTSSTTKRRTTAAPNTSSASRSSRTRKARRPRPSPSPIFSDSSAAGSSSGSDQSEAEEAKDAAQAQVKIPRALRRGAFPWNNSRKNGASFSVQKAHQSASGQSALTRKKVPPKTRK